jgi:uncharacterized membrane protein YdjX (TVP38/TMEM64 family)
MRRRTGLTAENGAVEARDPVPAGDSTGEDVGSTSIKDLLMVVLVGVIFLLLALIFRSELASGLFDNVHRIRALLKSDIVPGGLAGSGAVFVLLTGTLITLGVPRIWISALGGAVYGAALGAVLSLLSTVMGASILFYAGSTFLGSVVQRRFQSRASRFALRLNREAFWWTLYLRLFPFTNSTVQSLLFGSLRVPFKAYISGSILGFIPLTVIFAVFGSGGVKSNYNQIWLGFGLIAVVVLIRHLANRIARVKTSASTT